MLPYARTFYIKIIKHHFKNCIMERRLLFVCRHIYTHPCLLDWIVLQLSPSLFPLLTLISICSRPPLDYACLPLQYPTTPLLILPLHYGECLDGMNSLYVPYHHLDKDKGAIGTHPHFLEHLVWGQSVEIQVSRGWGSSGGVVRGLEWSKIKMNRELIGGPKA